MAEKVIEWQMNIAFFITIDHLESRFSSRSFIVPCSVVRVSLLPFPSRETHFVFPSIKSVVGLFIVKQNGSSYRLKFAMTVPGRTVQSALIPDSPGSPLNCCPITDLPKWSTMMLLLFALRCTTLYWDELNNFNLIYYHPNLYNFLPPSKYAGESNYRGFY